MSPIKPILLALIFLAILAATACNPAFRVKKKPARRKGTGFLHLKKKKPSDCGCSYQELLNEACPGQT